MATFATLKTSVSRDLHDPGLLTFDDTAVGDFVNEGLAEIGRIAPFHFQDDIVPVQDELEYALHPSNPGPEVELVRVEVWDASTTPNRFLRLLRPMSGEYSNTSAAGWFNWGGTLYLTNMSVTYIDPLNHIIRTWGYAPYPPLVGDSDVVPLTNELTWALRSFCKVAALSRLSIERDLFTQWQTKSNNADVTPAGLMSALQSARDDWRRRSKAIAVLREAR